MLITPNVSGIVGCTYPNATNYLSYATIESGTCTFEGCMDPEANNFQTFALSDDGSCDYECAPQHVPAMSTVMARWGPVICCQCWPLLVEFASEKGKTA